jgi:CRISPR-associated endonuclease Csn1
MARIFGLDIGTTSIGFAVVALDEKNETGSVSQLGVRIFPEARDPDGTPLNQQRRAKRMMRRQLRRRRERRRALNEHLAAHGLLPAFGSPEWARTMAADPYELRARGLGAPLLAYELGRALYHLSKRRHFQERDLAEDQNREKEKPKPEEDAEAKQRDSFSDELKKSGETLGAHLAKIPPLERKRGIHATRAIVREEFDRLCAAQAPHHPVLHDPNFRAGLEEAIVFQRPVFWRKSTLGSCPFGLRPGISLSCSTIRRSPQVAQLTGRPMPGRKAICRASAGSISTPRAAASATSALSALRSCAIPATRSRSMAPSSGSHRSIWAWRCK